MIIAPTLAALQPTPRVQTLEFASIAEFLDACTTTTATMLAYEARRSFALTLGGLFERQLWIWSRAHFTADDKQGMEKQTFFPLLQATARKHRISLHWFGIGEDIRELYLVANAVRHGDGSSIAELRLKAGHLWPSMTDRQAEQCDAMGIWSEAIQIADVDLGRYVEAVCRFWGLADREQGAMIDPLLESVYRH